MADLPPFEKMPVEELRTWPAKRICELHPRVERVRGEKDESKKVLTLWVTWREGTTPFQEVLPEKMMQRTLDRWVWEGWTVELRQELPWKIHRKPPEGAPAQSPRPKKAAPRSDWEAPPGYFADLEPERPRRRRG